jgi:ribosomal protein S18 acetylase RimI-like enzyme
MESSGSGLKVRRATERDLEPIVHLFGSYREFYHQAIDPPAERQFLRDRLARDQAVVFVAEEGSVAVGFALLYPSFSSISLLPIWVLNDLYVVPDRRRRGVAAQLLRRALAFAAETGADYLTLETAKENPAQHLYEAEGWTRDEAFLHYEHKVERARRSTAAD